MIENDYIVGFVSALIAVGFGAFLQYMIQKKLNSSVELDKLKQTLVKEINSHLSAIDRLVSFTDDEPEKPHLILKDRNLIAYYDRLFFEGISKVETAYELLKAKFGDKLGYDKELESIKEELIDSYGHSLGDPSIEARKKSVTVHKKLRELYSKMKKEVLGVNL